MKFTAVVACSLALVAAQNVAAQAAAPTSTPAPPAPSADLPSFTFVLTSLPVGERDNLCAQNKGFCITSCGAEKPPMNFCNSTTMGWGCGCINKVPDYLGYQWPINYAHCTGSQAACQKACTAGNNACFAACAKTWGGCGSPSQPPAYYQVSDIAQIPTYAPPTAASNGTSSNGTSTAPAGSSSTSKPAGTSSSANSGLSFNLVSTLSALTIVAAGMMML
jgi:hypothetical protein